MIRIFGILFILVACSQPVAPLKVKTSQSDGRPQRTHEFIRAEYQSTKAALNKGNEISTYDVEAYRLKASFDWTRKVMTGDLQIRFNLVNPELSELPLDCQVYRVLGVTTADGAPMSYSWKGREKLFVSLTGFSQEEKRGTLEIAVRYEALANSLLSGDRVGLNSVEARPGDPLTTRVIFTHSEPLGASTWLPSHDTPSDRATFASEFTVSQNEMFIANGTLSKNTVDPVQGTRTVSYETTFTLPTYIMAFAVGEFEVFTRQLGSLPISLVTRRGLPLDHRSMLDMLVEQMTRFQELLGPYPFQSYSLVLLPEFGGGMEHVGITFQDEIGSASGKLSPDYWLSAHEMAHQWFGDLVTIQDWDDLWIKEGMATLMAEEASRKREDVLNSGRLFGRNFQPDSGDAIRDTELSPDEKYTSGPYDRSAWFFTQLRSVMGEARFWATWRRLLKEFSYGAIGTEDVLKAFSAEVGPTIAKGLLKALAAKVMPQLIVEPEGDSKIKIAVADVDGALIVPIQLRQYTSPSVFVTSLLDKPVILNKAETKFLVVDPHDAQAMVRIWETQKEELTQPEAIIEFSWPKETAELDVLAAIGPHAMVQTLEAGFPRRLTPELFLKLYEHSGSQELQFRLLQTACEGAQAGSALEAAWTDAILRALRRPPYFGMHSDFMGLGLSMCQSARVVERFSSDLMDLHSKESPALEEVIFLSRWRRNLELSYDVWGSLAQTAQSVSVRVVAIDTLAKFFALPGPLQPVGAEKDRWMRTFSRFLSESDVTKALGPVLNYFRSAKDTSSTTADAFLSIVKRDAPWKAKLKTMCTAHELGKTDPAFIEKMKAQMPSDMSELFKRALIEGVGC